MNVCMYRCVHTYLCMYACMYVRTYVCMYICMHYAFVTGFEKSQLLRTIINTDFNYLKCQERKQMSAWNSPRFYNYPQSIYLPTVEWIPS